MAPLGAEIFLPILVPTSKKSASNRKKTEKKGNFFCSFKNKLYICNTEIH